MEPEQAPNFSKIGTRTAINHYGSTTLGTIMKKGRRPVFWQHAVEMNMGLSLHLQILVYHHCFDLNTILIRRTKNGVKVKYCKVVLVCREGYFLLPFNE